MRLAIAAALFLTGCSSRSAVVGWKLGYEHGLSDRYASPYWFGYHAGYALGETHRAALGASCKGDECEAKSP